MVNSDHPGRQVAYHGIASINHGVELNSLLLNAPSLGVDYQSLAIAYQQKHHENDEGRQNEQRLHAFHEVTAIN